MDSTRAQTIATLKKLCSEWDQAIALNDVPRMSKFMAPDWVIVGTEGGITSKPDFLKFIEAGDLVHSAMDFEDVRIEIYANTGIVTSKGSSIGTYKGNAFNYFEWSTSVFIHAEEQWRCVLTMLTPAQT